MNRTISRVRTCLVCIALLLHAWPCSVFAEPDPQVRIVTSSGSSYQKILAERIISDLGAAGIAATSTGHHRLEKHAAGATRLYVAIGSKAVATVRGAGTDVPVLRLITSGQDAEAHSTRDATFYLDQPTCRSLALVKAVNPEWKNIAVLASASSDRQIAELAKCAFRYNLNLNLYPITDNSDLLASLETAADRNDVLLGIADSGVYNRQSIKNILLTAYRYRKPVIGYSENFVQAGAIAAVFTSADSAAKRAGTLIRHFLANRDSFAQTYFPESFSVSVNPQVARALDIKLDTAEGLRARILELEAGR